MLFISSFYSLLTRINAAEKRIEYSLPTNSADIGQPGMAVRVMNYKGFQLRAGAFEVPALNGFLSSLLVIRFSPSMAESTSKLFTPRCDCGNGLFGTEEKAIEAAILFGEKLVDGEVAGLTVADI